MMTKNWSINHGQIRKWLISFHWIDGVGKSSTIFELIKILQNDGNKIVRWNYIISNEANYYKKLYQIIHKDVDIGIKLNALLWIYKQEQTIINQLINSWYIVIKDRSWFDIFLYLIWQEIKDSNDISNHDQATLFYINNFIKNHIKPIDPDLLILLKCKNKIRISRIISRWNIEIHDIMPASDTSYHRYYERIIGYILSQNPSKSLTIFSDRKTVSDIANDIYKVFLNKN